MVTVSCETVDTLGQVEKDLVTFIIQTSAIQGLTNKVWESPPPSPPHTWWCSKGRLPRLCPGAPALRLAQPWPESPSWVYQSTSCTTWPPAPLWSFLWRNGWNACRIDIRILRQKFQYDLPCSFQKTNYNWTNEFDKIFNYSSVAQVSSYIEVSWT